MITDVIRKQIYKLKAENKNPTVINLSVDQAFDLLEEVNLVMVGNELFKGVLLTRNENELLKLFNDSAKKVTFFGVPVNLFKVVE